MSTHADRSDAGTEGHELVDHTSEVTLRLRARSFAALLAEATRAFGDLVPDALRGEPDGERRHFRIGARDRAATLVDWLNEMVYSCEADQWLPVDAEAAESEGGLTVSARGIELRAPFVLVKAATLHNAVVLEGPEGFEGEVTLDV